MKKITQSIVMALLLSTAQADSYNQQEKDISKVVKELAYLIQVTEQLQQKYRGDTSKIRFNYPVYIQQLKAMKSMAQEYLNAELYELHTAPPPVRKPSVIEVSP